MIGSMRADMRRAGLTWPEMLAVCLILSVAGIVVTSAAIRSVQMPKREPVPRPPLPKVAPVPSVASKPDSAPRKPEPGTVPVAAPAKKPEPEADPGLSAAIRTGLPSMMKMLIQGGADVNQPDADGLTPLGLAARLGRLQCVQLLLASGAKVSGGTEAGHAPIVEATANKHLYVAIMLLDNGADKKARSAQGLSLMHIAAEKGSQELIKLFLRRGLSVNDAIPADYKYFKHRTPLDFALGARDLEVVSLLMENGAVRGKSPE